MEIKVQCNFCNAEIKEGSDFLQLYGHYLKVCARPNTEDNTEFIHKVDHVRPFWSLCDSCRTKIINNAGSKTKIKLVIEE